MIQNLTIEKYSVLRFSEYHSRQLLTYTDRSINKNKFIISRMGILSFKSSVYLLLKNKSILTFKNNKNVSMLILLESNRS